MKDLYISFGSNKGDCVSNLTNAIERLSVKLGPWVLCSAYYRSSSWGFESDDFVNAVALFQTDLAPKSCLDLVLSVEQEMGRRRGGEGYSSRIIDIDLISYGDMIANMPGLQLPHPRAAERLFVLMPWAEISPDCKVPGFPFSVQELLDQCPDQGNCTPLAHV